MNRAAVESIFRSRWAGSLSRLRPARASSPRPAPRGSAYVLVLVSTAIAAIVGISAVAIVRANLRSTTLAMDAAAAQFHTRSGVDLALYLLRDNLNWTETHPDGVILDNHPVGGADTGAAVTVTLEPADEDLYGPGAARVTARARRGEAVQIMTLIARPRAHPIGALRGPLHAHSAMDFDSASVYSDHAISSNAPVTASASDIYAHVETAGTASGGVYHRDVHAGAPAREMPADPIAQYTSEGTQILYSDLPAGTIQRVVLSPNSNPFGPATNAKGVYVIDCAGSAITIQDCRIVGTLVLLDPGSGSLITSSVNFEPAVPNYPVVLVRGDLDIRTSPDLLSESGLGVNFNPSGTPYQGQSNSTLDDTYPSRIRGLIYASGRLRTRNHVDIAGAVIADRFEAREVLILEYNQLYTINPPHGFRTDARLTPMPGTWARVVR